MGIGNICVVTFTDEEASDEQLDEAVRSAFEDHFRLTPRTYLVRSPKLTSEIAEALRIKGDERRFTGAVLRMNPHYYSGYAQNELWEWLARSENNR